MRVLVINCGSATLKYKLFEERGGGLEVLAAASVEIQGGYRAAAERDYGVVLTDDLEINWAATKKLRSAPRPSGGEPSIRRPPKMA